MSEANIPLPELGQAVVESGGETLYYCLQCGLCTASCPWRLVEGEISREFNIRRLEHMAQLGLEGYETENILFACTTCNQCGVRCPREVKPVENIRVLRTMIAEAGSTPPALRPVIGSLKSEGNPWQGERSKRLDWTEGLSVPRFDADSEYLLFVCCTSCYDSRSRKIARALVKVLQAAGVSFGIIGEEESCCGESARKIGAEDTFQALAGSNIKLFSERGVRKIVTTSPHCLWTLRHEYPELGGDFEVVHYTELLAQLIADDRLKLTGKLEGRVAYHDPCYLGRHSEVFEAPRQVLDAITTERVELSRYGRNSICCGGGGGRIWLETPPGERFGDLRVADARSQGARTLATACPYCTIMLDASNMDEQESELHIKDIAELLAECL